MIKLPVLVYGKMEPELHDDFVYKLNYFRNQLETMQNNGYRPITCQELIDYLFKIGTLPAKPVLITFDGGYAVNFRMARIVLMEFGFKATFFFSGETVLKITCGEPGFTDEYMHIEQVRQLHKDGFELALHGYSPLNIATLPPAALKAEIEKNMVFFKKFDLPFIKAIGCPHEFSGNSFARSDAWLESMQQLEMNLAFVPGRRINQLPQLNTYAIERIGIDRLDAGEVLLRKFRRGTRTWFW